MTNIKKHILSRNEYRDVVEFIKENYNVNLSQFAFSITKRRIETFFAQYNVSNLQMIFNFLKKEKFWNSLFEFLIIPTTEMFRDYEVWVKLKNKILSKLSKLEEIKIWIPDVSTDDELLTILIILKELDLIDKTKVVITSEYEKAEELIKKQGISQKKFDASNQNYLTYIPNGKFEQFFIKSATKISLKSELFKNVVFKKYSFTYNTNFEKDFDLILFRNRMLNYSPLLQKKALDNVYNSLCIKGYLIIGLKETLENWTLRQKMNVTDKEINIFQKKK